MQPSPFQITTGAGGISTSNIDYLYVPLQFWFNRNVGLSTPLIALQYHQVDIIINISSIYSELNITEFSLWCNYIYLDTDERRRFAQVSHEYLIEQVQTQNNVVSNSINNIELIFNHPVKELIWVALHVEWGSNNDYSGLLVNLMYQFGIRILQLIYYLMVKIDFNNKNRIFHKISTI